MAFLEQLICQNSWGSTLEYFRKTALEGEEPLEYSRENWFSLGKISLWTRATECFTMPGHFGSEKEKKNLAFQLVVQHRVGLLSHFQKQETRSPGFRCSVPPTIHI